MKLRVRGNSLRLRLNQREVANLASGQSIEEAVAFPGNKALVYRLVPESSSLSGARLENCAITLSVPADVLREWNSSDEIGIYYDVEDLHVSIEKDLECTDAPRDEQDPYAYPRKAAC